MSVILEFINAHGFLRFFELPGFYFQIMKSEGVNENHNESEKPYLLALWSFVRAFLISPFGETC